MRRQPTPARRPWCGSCQKDTRRLEHHEDGRDLGPCPRCHPLAAPPATTNVPPLGPRPATPAPRPVRTLDDVTARHPDAVRRDAERIVAAFARSGQEFSSNELRPYLDRAAIAPSLRGAVIAAALKAERIVEVGTTRSTDPGTHGKRIGVYRGTGVSVGRLALCTSCGHDLDPVLVAERRTMHPTCVAPSDAASSW